jgi:hypothetical protein
MRARTHTVCDCEQAELSSHTGGEEETILVAAKLSWTRETLTYLGTSSIGAMTSSRPGLRQRGSRADGTLQDHLMENEEAGDARPHYQEVRCDTANVVGSGVANSALGVFRARRADGNTKQAAVVLAGPLHDQRDVRIIPLRAARSEGTGRLVEVRTEAATRPTSTVPP